MRKIIILLLLLCSCSPTEEIRIGVIAPLSGPTANWGQNVVKAIDLAYEELDHDQVKIIYEDDQLDPSQTISAYRKLKNEGIDAIITVASGPSNAIAPLAEEDGIIMIALSTHEDITKEREYVFKHFLIPKVEEEVFHKEVVRQGYSRVVMFSSQQEGVLAIKDAVLEISQGDPRYYQDQAFALDERDFSTAIAKASEADAIALFMLPGQIGTMAKQIREFSDVPIIGMGTMQDKKELETAQGALEGSWFSAPAGPSDEIIAKHILMYGDEPGLFSGNAYDAATILFEAFLEEEPLEYVRTLEGFNGAMGEHLFVDETNTIQSPAVIKRIEHGKFKI